MSSNGSDIDRRPLLPPNGLRRYGQTEFSVNIKQTLAISCQFVVKYIRKTNYKEIKMKNLKGALLFAQSGGPTSVINASACGVFEEAFRHGEITQVLGAAHGVVGILNDELYDMGKEDPAEIHRLLGTPSSALGSCRYKLKDYRDDETDYLRILEVFKKHNVKYFFYNGGNDSMDTCNKIGEFVNAHGYECNVVGVPKTIDNDLYGIDHCPGYASAAKYIATTCMEIDLDARVFDKGMITVIEIMGRHAGWLTAASAVATYAGHGPDLIYVPETDFDLDKFTADVKSVFEKNGKCIVAVSEGIHDKDGKFIAEYAAADAKKDAFGHVQLGGTASFLVSYLGNHINTKYRAIEFSLMQRCAAHIASKVDVKEAYAEGCAAVKAAVEGKSNIMVGVVRKHTEKYETTIEEFPLSACANTEKKLPAEYINADGNMIEKSFLDYILPLIEGEHAPEFINGVPRFAELKKVLAK